MLHFKVGKKYFDHLNVIMLIFFGLITLASMFTVFQSFGLASLLQLGINILFTIYSKAKTLGFHPKPWPTFEKVGSKLLSKRNSIAFLLNHLQCFLPSLKGKVAGISLSEGFFAFSSGRRCHAVTDEGL